VNLSFSIGVALLTLQSVLPIASLAQTRLTYTTSWIGNSFGFGDGKWVQLDIQAMGVALDGTVYTNAPWDESGSELGVYRDGDKIGIAGQTHGWGNRGGDAVATNHAYLYAAMSIENENDRLLGADYPPKGRTWFGITRRPLRDITRGAPFAGGIANSSNSVKDSFLLLNAAATGTDAAIRGLAANEDELYVADTYRDQIIVFDAITMKRLRSWSVPSPSRIAIGSDDTLWVLRNFRSARGPNIAHYTAYGALLADAPRMPPSSVAVDLAIGPSGQLFVADNGPAQQILIFGRMARKKLEVIGKLGALGGIFSGRKGTLGDWRFNGITAIGFDRNNYLYVAQNGEGPRRFGQTSTGHGTVLESYTYATRKLNWRLEGLTFVDSAACDPASPTHIFTGDKRFVLDYGRGVGHEWSYAGFTLGRFDFPEDPGLYNPRGQPMVRRIYGKLYLYTLDPYVSFLGIYRFDTTHGELAIPSGFLTQKRLLGNWPKKQPASGEWLWRDSNGNGVVEAEEISRNPTTANIVRDGFWWVDSPGNIWLATTMSGIRELPLQGIDSAGNPVYRYSESRWFPMPAPFVRIGRIVYIADTDTMFVSGYTKSTPWDSSLWKEAGSVLVRYDNWSSRAPSRRFMIVLPWNTQSTPKVTTVGIAVAGNYIFVTELYTQKVTVYDARSGQAVGYMVPGASVGNTGGWVDVYLGISAMRRDNGEYIVLVEDDARAKILMYRWVP
jgi:hypothetical protein